MPIQGRPYISEPFCLTFTWQPPQSKVRLHRLASFRHTESCLHFVPVHDDRSKQENRIPEAPVPTECLGLIVMLQSFDFCHPVKDYKCSTPKRKEKWGKKGLTRVQARVRGYLAWREEIEKRKGGKKKKKKGVRDKFYFNHFGFYFLLYVCLLLGRSKQKQEKRKRKEKEKKRKRKRNKNKKERRENVSCSFLHFTLLYFWVFLSLLFKKNI